MIQAHGIELWIAIRRTLNAFSANFDMNTQIANSTTIKIQVSSVSRPTSHYGWRWAVSGMSNGTIQCFETEVDGSKLYALQPGYLINKRTLIDETFYLNPNEPMFDAIGALESQLRRIQSTSSPESFA